LATPCHSPSIFFSWGMRTIRLGGVEFFTHAFRLFALADRSNQGNSVVQSATPLKFSLRSLTSRNEDGSLPRNGHYTIFILFLSVLLSQFVYFFHQCFCVKLARFFNSVGIRCFRLNGH
jgi:hypothetical protein